MSSRNGGSSDDDSNDDTDGGGGGGAKAAASKRGVGSQPTATRIVDEMRDDATATDDDDVLNMMAINPIGYRRC